MRSRRIQRLFAMVAAVLVLLCTGYALYRVSRSWTFQFFAPLLTRVETEEKRVALTIDDGPSERTGKILASLDALDIPATFFLCGGAMAERPDDAKAIVQAGHEIGNHSFSHRRMLFVSYGFCRREVEDTNARIREAGYQGTIYFRPPYGKKLFVLPWYLRSAGMTSVMADVAPDSKLGTDASAEALADYMVTHVQPGSIVLLHAMYNDNSLDAIALGVSALKEQGYTFVTLDQLIQGA